MSKDDEMSYQEKLNFAALLEVGLDEKLARALAIAQSRECGSRAMSPAEMDIHIPHHGMSLETMYWVSDYLEEVVGENPPAPSVACPICGDTEEGTITEMGFFLLCHQAYHLHEQNIAPMHDFGNDTEVDDSEEEEF